MSSTNFMSPLIAHRGANVIAPENTLAAFLAAKELGAKWIEFDVMLAASGEAVVIHDETLDRTTNGTGNVCDHPYSYLKTLDAGSWFGLEFAGERIPTFKEVIVFLKQHQMAANIEIKAVEGQEEAVVKTILADIKECWTDEMALPLISSFSMPILQHVRQQAPKAMIGVLIHEWFAGWEDICKMLACTSVNLNQEIITAEKIQTIQAMNKLILSYTVNTIERAHELFTLGVNAVFTDEFERLNEYFSQESFY
jgi:glycerophosphoryl diester phosphodiesterase